MGNEQAEFWSAVADKYDRVVDLQIGPDTRAMVRDRVAQERQLGQLVEFGCGTGFYTQALANKADRLLATDVAPGMVAAAEARIRATNVTFQVEDCQHTSLPDGAIDTAFIALVLHFTEPRQTVSEMHRILKRGGTLIVVNLDLQALSGLNRVRSLIRIAYRGISGYRVKPPKAFGRNVLTEQHLCDLVDRAGFCVMSTETMWNRSRSSNIPLEYVRARKL